MTAHDPSEVVPAADPAAALAPATDFVEEIAAAVASAIKGDGLPALDTPAVGDDVTYVSFPIVKVDKTPDGDLLVSGKATDETLDSDLQIIDHKFASTGLPRWFETGANIRVQHSPYLYPAGTGAELETKSDGQWLTARVVEPTAKLLVEKGVLQAFSVGIARPKIVRDQVAKGGRIVDGEFVEVSLVDRPANSACKFTVCKAAKGDGHAEPVETLEAPAELLKEMATSHDPFDGTHSHAHPAFGDQGDDHNHEHEHTHNGDADHDHGHHKHVDADAKKKDMSTAEMNDAPDDDFAYIEPGGHKDDDGKTVPRTKRHFYIADAAHVRNALSRIGQGAEFGDEAMPKVKAAAKRFGIDVSGDSKKGTSLNQQSTYALKRLHDAFCCAYDWDAVVEHYPALEKGAALMMGQTAKQIIYQMLCDEVTEDGGAGDEAYDIAQIAKAYETFCNFLSGEVWEAVNGDMADAAYLDARAHMHKLFKEANSSGGDVGGEAHWPTPGDVDPGMFRRPLITAGRERRSTGDEPGAKPVIPASGPIDAADFTRGNLTAGHERPSPGDAATKDGGGRMFYTNDARDAVSVAVSVIHDQLANIAPHLCPMDVDRPPTTGSPFTFPADSATPGAGFSMAADSVPSPVADPAAGGRVSKAAGAVDMDAIREMVTAEVEKVAGPLRDENERLLSRVEELEAEPDPAMAPLRGGRTTDRLTVEKRATDEAEAQKVAEKAAKEAQDGEFREMLERQALSGDPELRERARRVLKSRFPDSL